MSRLGIGEITLVTLILLVLAPDAVPKLMRKVGQLVASLQKMSKEVNDQIVAPILGERATRIGHRVRRGESGQTR